MTVVIGQRPKQEEIAALPPARADRIRTDLTWEMRRARYWRDRQPAAVSTWQPAPDLPRTPVVTASSPARESDPVRPGLMLLYAARMAHAHVDLASVRRTAPGERVLVGRRQGVDVPVCSLAIVGAATPLGRGSEGHYRRLHPAVAPRLGRLRCGGQGMTRQGELGNQQGKAGLGALPGHVVAGVRALLGLDGAGHLYPRTGASRRALVAVLAAILVLASAASTGFAQQYRYTVEAGDTIDSIATTFGVDPEAIRTSSYLPDGDALTVGQVLVIPEEGQSPTDAAQMAAANEGTSPWVATAYWVENGDNPASIAGMFGVSVQDLLDFNGIEDPLELIPGTRIMIPVGGSTPDSPESSAITVDGVPEYKQQRNLSCEYAATHAAAMTFGWAPDEQVFIDSIPDALNPHYGYRGNIDGWWGNTQDYGIYAEPLVPVLNDWGFHGEVMYTFGDVGPLIEHIDAGHPVVTWLGFWGDTRERLTDEGSYSVFAGMHVVTVYGYDDEGVWVMDPAKGQKVHYSWDFFVDMWTVIDGMSLAVYPA